MLSMLISIESILHIIFLEKYFFLKFYQYSPYSCCIDSTVSLLMIKQALGKFALIAIVTHIWLAPKHFCSRTL